MSRIDFPREISRRHFLQLGGGLAALGLKDRDIAAAPARRPNILYVFSDMQQATSLGCYGNPDVRTPALDAFARQSVRLDACISNTPVCCPHRASLMTGLYGHHSGVVSNGVEFIRQARGFAEQFRAAGYVTGYAGKWHIPKGYGTEDSMPLGFPREQIGGRGKGGRGHFTVVKTRDDAGREIEKEVYTPTL